MFKRRKVEQKLIEGVNDLQGEELIQRIFPNGSLDQAIHIVHTLSHPESRLKLAFLSSSALGNDKSLLDECVGLVEESSAHDYQASEVKWSTPKKRREMVLPDMRYLILTTSNLTDNGSPASLAGFASFMFTYEDGHEVVYIYEIHLKHAYRRNGLGKILLNLIEQAGSSIGVKKTMLTVFVSNGMAGKWYEKCGYSVDAFSPGPRVLRNGTVKQPSYRILSKLNS